jgi:hypothetical protein
VTSRPTYEGLGLEGLTVYLRDCDSDDPAANNNVVDGDFTGGDNPGRRCSDAIRRVASTLPALGRRVNRLEWNLARACSVKL